MEKLVSVLIPVYNREEVVTECVDSVLAQSYSHMEILLVDDGSTDRTLEICRRLAEKDSRIRLLERPHGGVSATRNAGLDAAKGDFVFFVDSDDIIHPQLLRTLVDGVQNSDAKMAAVERIDILQKNWSRAYDLMAAETRWPTTYKSNEQARHAMFFTSSPLRVMGGILMHRELIGSTRFQNGLSIGEDFAFIYENLIKGPSVIFLEHPWYYGRIHRQNASWDYTYTGFRSRFDRRKFVWETEESFGRTQYANAQKRDTFGAFVRCVTHPTTNAADRRKMRAVMRQHKHALLPALSRKEQVLFHMSIYTPAVFAARARIKALRSGRTAEKR